MRLLRKGVLHPNGFVVRLLQKLPLGMRLRLHTWPSGKKRLDSPHDHRSWFVSLPLWGTFEEKRYETSSQIDYDVILCHQTSGNGKPVTTPAGCAGLEPKTCCNRAAGIPYFCPGDAIHSFVPRGPGFAASLVLFGPPSKVPRAYIRRTR